MPMSRSYTARALLALGFLFLFYGLALAIAAALLLIPYLEITVAHRIHLKLALLCVIGAGVIVWSILPRRSKWEAPGPLITEADQPRLFATIRTVADRMGATVPHEVYLIPELNAFVMQRGGFFGLGGRRVMGIGVPLLAVSQVSQLHAILAHEFGHYQGGETRLASVIYQTRNAMVRTLVNLHKSGAALLHKPFEWMLSRYLQITQAIARQQELAADEWAVRIAGKQAQAEALKSTGVHGAGFDVFVENEVKPLLAMGVVPDNLFAGFRRFLHSTVWNSLRPEVSAALERQETDPFDSHPPQPERLAHIEGLPAPDAPLPRDESPAYQLLVQPEQIEGHFSKDFHRPGVEVVSWDNIAPTWAKMWRTLAERVQVRAPDSCPGRIAALCTDETQRIAFVEQVSPRLVGYRRDDHDQQTRTCCLEYLSAYLGTLLSDVGWIFHTAPGEPVQLQRSDDSNATPERVHVREVLRELLEGKLPVEDFLGRLSAWGLPLHAQVAVPEDRRTDLTAQRTPVLVIERDNATDVETNLSRILLPQCCALCCGPAEHEQTVNLVVNRILGDNQIVQIPLCACGPHLSEIHKAIKIKKLDDKSGDVTLQIAHRPFAELLRRCNA